MLYDRYYTHGTQWKKQIEMKSEQFCTKMITSVIQKLFDPIGKKKIFFEELNMWNQHNLKQNVTKC